MLTATYLVIENAGVFPRYVVAMTVIRKANVHVGTFGGGNGYVSWSGVSIYVRKGG